MRWNFSLEVFQFLLYFPLICLEQIFTLFKSHISPSIISSNRFIALHIVFNCFIISRRFTFVLKLPRKKTFIIIRNKKLKCHEDKEMLTFIETFESLDDETLKQTTPSSASSGTDLHFMRRNQSWL